MKYLYVKRFDKIMEIDHFHSIEVEEYMPNLYEDDLIYELFIWPTEDEDLLLGRYKKEEDAKNELEAIFNFLASDKNGHIVETTLQF